MTLTHDQARELVQRSLQTRLDDFERASLDAHLAGCAPCAAYRAGMGLLDRRLGESLAERWPEPRGSAAVMNQRLDHLHSQMRRDWMLQKIFSAGRLAAAAAVLILIVLSLGLLVRGATRQPIVGGGITPTAERAAAAQTQPAAAPPEAHSTPVVTSTPGCTDPRYTVSAGDTLIGIALANNTSVDALTSANHLADGVIMVGQALVIPVCGAAAPVNTPQPASARLYYFYWNGCQNCDQAKAWVDGLSERYPALEVIPLEISQNADNYNRYVKLSLAHGVDANISPAFFIGDQRIIGWNDATPNALEAAVKNCLSTRCPDAETVLVAKGRLALPDAEKRVRDYIYANNPDMNPEAAFPLKDITPEDVWTKLGGQVFKVTDGVQVNEDYYLGDGIVYKLGTAFGGAGITQMVTADVDGNGSPELIYTFSFGSGIAQSGLGLLFNAGADVLVFEPSDLRYPGALDLQKISDSQVVVTSTQNGSSPVTLGEVRILNGQVLIAPADVGLVTYTDPVLGIAFEYPGSWKLQADGSYRDGSGAFFKIEALDYPTRDINRACEWKAYQGGPAQGADNPPPYGSSPSIEIGSGARESCIIRSTMSGKGYESGIIFGAPDGQLMLLGVDVEMADLIAKTLRFTLPAPTASPVPLDMNSAPEVSTAKVATRVLGGLTLGEFAVVSADKDTPGHFEFMKRIPDGVFPYQAEWFANSQQADLDLNNRLLQPFGFRLEKNGEQTRLFHGSELVRDNLRTVYPVSTAADGSDFALLVSEGTMPEHYLLVRNGGIEDFAQMIHQNAQPVFAGNRLITLQTDLVQADGALTVLVDGKAAARLNAFFGPKDPVRGLTAWDGKWALEVDGTLFVEGENINLSQGYSEVFNARLLNGKPFYFFEKDGRVGISYGGQALPVQYDAVIHDQCCEPAAFNVQNAPDALWFYAKRDGVWYWVEIKG